MEITQQADYAVRAVLDLALQTTPDRVAADGIAHRQSIPPAFLTKILSRLAAAGIVVTQRGANGGTRLARSAQTITLLDVVEAIDGPITLNRCARHPSECSRDQACMVHPIWMKLCGEVRARLASYTFADVAAQASDALPPHSSIVTLFEELPMSKLQ